MRSSSRNEHLLLVPVAVAERAAFFFLLLHVAVVSFVLFVVFETKMTKKLVDVVPVVL